MRLVVARDEQGEQRRPHAHLGDLVADVDDSLLPEKALANVRAALPAIGAFILSGAFMYVGYSMAKSVTSALVGIAINEGAIQGVDQKVADFVRMK